jgi:Flp pilus assembly protein TadD
MLKYVFRYIKVFIVFLVLYNINTGYVFSITLKEDAEKYRAKGYESQENGDIDTAISFYQKAAGLDPGYAAPHNDLGILFESKGWLERAEDEYLKALAIDAKYEKAHANLAMLYERKGELEKAAFHWMRRYKLGRPDDPWTREARQRLEKLGLIDKDEDKTVIEKSPRESQHPKKEFKEEKKTDSGADEWTRVGQPASKPSPEKEKVKVKEKPVVPEKSIKKAPERQIKKEKKSGSMWTRLGAPSKKIKEPVRVSNKKDIDSQLKESLMLAEKRLKEQKAEVPAARKEYLTARNYYDKGEYAKALDTIRIAKKDYPDDSSLKQLEQVIKTKMKEEKIEDHCNEGIIRYRQNDFSGAKKEFESILNILPE